MEKIFGSIPPTEKDLERLIADRVPAGHHLVYLPAGLGTPSSNHELVEAVASLANAHGGLVVLGVKAEGGRPLEMVGLGGGDPERSLKEARRTLVERTHPTVDAHVTVVRLAGGGHTLVIEVPPSPDAPHLADGVYPQRHGRTNAVMSPAEIDRVRAHRRNVLEGLRARARELADAAQHNRIVQVKAGGVGVYIYAASIPLAIEGREVDLGKVRLPRFRVLMGHAGDALELRLTYFGALGTRSVATKEGAEELAYLNRRGELLHGLPDARPFKISGDQFFCMSIDELLGAILQTLPRNLASLIGFGFEPPFYAALVGAGESTNIRFGQGASCGYATKPGDLLVEALLPLARMRTMEFVDGGEADPEIRREKLVHPVRPLLRRLYQAAGFASPWPEDYDEPS